MDTDDLKKNMQAKFDQGFLPEAQGIADALLADDPHDWDAGYMKAWILSLPDPAFFDKKTALDLINSLLHDNPDEARRWVGLGEISNQCGNYEQAQSAFDKALELDPGNYSAAIGLATLEDCPGASVNSSKLSEILQRAAKHEPDNWLAYSYLARVYARLGDKGKAREAYENAIQFIPKDRQHSPDRQGLSQELKNL